MELVQYVRLFRKWAWLIVVVAFVGGGIAYINALQAPTLYKAETTISIGGYLDQPNPDQSTIWTGRDLATTYAELVGTYSILQATTEALGLPFDGDALSGVVDTRIIEDTSLLVISVTYDDPTLAADIANTIADQLIRQSPSNLSVEQQAQIDFANQQVADLNAQLQDAREQVSLLDSQLESETDPEIIDTLTTQRAALIDQINDAAATMATFSYNVTLLQQRTNVVDVVEPARIPAAPIGSSPLRSALLGATVGAALVVGVILLIEYMDDKIRTSEQAVEALKLPVLGAIQRHGGKNDSYPNMLIPTSAWSPAAEGYRSLRTNLLFATTGREESKPIYLITSAGPEEGKTVTAANLAVTMAQAGIQVLLIDADLRRPRIHEIFSLPNDFGLTNLLFANPNGKDLANASEVEESIVLSGLKMSVQHTTIPRLRIITSGFIPSNPTEILGSALMQRWISVFLNSANVDVIIFDTPPALVASDSAVLATAVGANVVFVLDAGRTRIAAARKMKEQFEQLNARVRGIVLNRVNPREESYSYGYSYGYYYTQPADSNGKAPTEVEILKK